ncbi:3-oxoacyl-[acyl-carrier-protein] reductase [Candidatus Desantisbacteria bacterium CG1_02_38_46]|uniref:3-oxoacyl-[acyl-carrier-protein] reductase n=3 Tax=unclassified Candidatus Desantisiibacteriota TaxID=3106372 RepID=A0A2H9PD35_9BACT|nr:MAG: 3-oxoacyl-[acyl-carrier-protein] reductase [Candidatus Desantisbacteria bacterium CG1_02_38_46]PIU52227.1 MAG: beta-ketoacyl-ACP reductase [Candidatus Desantisbacteria bacterium CG07_land_8_20_14_0_80_39_15]PIZ17326.1 MAG: beta-ketoacyl-ACP reductase [Candidatus Desantisbacteria bacterium CG_4_10_14_0_8_um_filter_39_17]
MKLEGKVAIVTGSARGIGKAIALTLAREGANSVIIDVDEQEATKVTNEINLIGRDSIAFNVDVSNFAQVEDMVKKVMEKYGRIDILINNAGITRDALLIKMKEEDWDKVIDINLKGIFNCTRAVSGIMLKQCSGKILNMASIIGIIGNFGQANYAASKAGVIALTKTTAKEFASRGINVNAIAPGFIDTPMTQVLKEEWKKKLIEQIPLNRFGSPEDVAKLALFLVSDDSNYITGQVIRIDGGMAM